MAILFEISIVNGVSSMSHFILKYNKYSSAKSPYDFAFTSTKKLNNFGIVGGSQIKIEEAPYQAAIFHGSLLSCGAVIIDQHFLLTAAHCVKYEIKILI